MTHKELKKILARAGIGGYWGGGNMLFDREYRFPTKADFTEANRVAAKALDWYRYGPNLRDCDTYEFMHYGRVLEWFNKNTPDTVTASPVIGPVWGDYEGQGHMWGIVMFGPDELVHVNYGRISQPTSWKADGSIMV